MVHCLAVILLAQDAPARLPMLPLFVMIGVMFYLMILRPERRRRGQQAQMLQAIKKNDRVVTIGGIFGTVVNVYEDEVTIRIDEASGAKLRMLRSAISRIDEGKDKDKNGK